MKPPSVPLREFRGRVGFRLKSGQVLHLIRVTGNERPPCNAVAWCDGSTWHREFGGVWRRTDRSQPQLTWEWTP